MNKIEEIERLLLDMGPAQVHPTPMDDWVYYAPFVRDYQQTATCASYLPRWAAIWGHLRPRRYLAIGILLGTAESYAMRTTRHQPQTIVAVDVDLVDYNTDRTNLMYAYKNLTHPTSGGFDAELVLVRSDSKQTNIHRRLGPYDYAWVDGEHGYSAVQIDMDAAWETLEPGGVMAVHDLDLPGGDHEIRRGFRDWCVSRRITGAIEIPATHFQLGLGLCTR